MANAWPLDWRNLLARARNVHVGPGAYISDHAGTILYFDRTCDSVQAVSVSRVGGACRGALFIILATPRLCPYTSASPRSCSTNGHVSPTRRSHLFPTAVFAYEAFLAPRSDSSRTAPSRNEKASAGTANV